jgi:hypothetical protein
MDTHDATVWAAWAAVLVGAGATLFATTDARALRGAGLLLVGLAFYVVLSFLVPLPLVKTLHQRERERAVLDPRTVFKDRLHALLTEGGELVMEDLGLDAQTQAEEEVNWVYRVATFLEDSTGKSLADAFLQVVDTSPGPNVDEGWTYLLNLEARADTVHLRPSFNYVKWAE